MPQAYKRHELRPVDGGQLVIRQEEDLAGERIYVKKYNWRRDIGKEIRREGWERFRPVGDLPQGLQALEADDPVSLIFEFSRPNGQRAIVAAAGDTLYRFNDVAQLNYVESGYFNLIYSTFGGFLSGLGVEKVTIGGSTKLFIYDFESSESHNVPVLGSGMNLEIDGFTGGLTDFNGTFAVYGPINPQGILRKSGTGPYQYVYFVVPPEATWDSAPTGRKTLGTITKIDLLSGWVEQLTDHFEWFPIATGLATTGANRWEAVAINGYCIFNNGIDLPLTYRVEDTLAKPMYELREQGIVSVGVIQGFGGYLKCADITEIVTTDFVAWMNNGDPYGIVDEGVASIFRTQYRIIYSHPAEPRRWAVLAPGNILASQADFVASYPLLSFSVGQKVIINNAGTPTDGILETTILSISGDNITFTLVDSADPSKTVEASTMQAFDMVGSPSASVDLKDDGSRILAMQKLNRALLIYRTTGVFAAYTTGEVEQPFAYDEVYEVSGDKRQMPDYRHSIILNPVRNEHLYMTLKGVYSFDMVSRRPKELGLFRLGTDIFSRLTIADIESVFSIHNPDTREVWFCTPVETICYHYPEGETSLSIIDDTFTAAYVVRKPVKPLHSPAEEWFIMGKSDGIIYRNGLGDFGYNIFNREGLPYDSVLESGLMSFGDSFNEKHFKEYVLQIAFNKYSSFNIGIDFKDIISLKVTRRSEDFNFFDYEFISLNEYNIPSGGSGKSLEIVGVPDQAEFEGSFPLMADPVFASEYKTGTGPWTYNFYVIPSTRDWESTDTITIIQLPTSDLSIKLITDVRPQLDMKIEMLGTTSIGQETPKLLGTKTITPRVKNAIPIFFRSIFFKDRITVSGKDNPVAIAGRIISVSPIRSSSFTQLV